MPIIKFKVASFKETDSVDTSIPIFIGSGGVKTGNPSGKTIWSYEITDTNGNVYQLNHQRTRQKIRKGQVIMTAVQKGTSWIQSPWTESQFIQSVCSALDRHKADIEKAKEEIERLRAL